MRMYTERKDVDLSLIAKKYGGGGHAGACGFQCAELPFRLPVKES
jgi:nanoRNase/pAp phosphatase (c-di-AMP/oligoRNAs hydrolase)